MCLICSSQDRLLLNSQTSPTIPQGLARKNKIKYNPKCCIFILFFSFKLWASAHEIRAKTLVSLLQSLFFRIHRGNFPTCTCTYCTCLSHNRSRTLLNRWCHWLFHFLSFFFSSFFYLPSVIEPLFWLVFLSSVGCFVFLFSSFLMFASDAESFQGQSQTVLLKWVQDIVLQTVLADLRARLSDVSLQNSRFHLLWVQTKRNKLDVSPTLTVTLRTF